MLVTEPTASNPCVIEEVVTSIDVVVGTGWPVAILPAAIVPAAIVPAAIVPAAIVPAAIVPAAELRSDVVARFR